MPFFNTVSTRILSLRTSKPNSKVWKYKFALINPNAHGVKDIDQFGLKIAVSNSYVAVYAEESDAGGNQSGKVYVYNHAGTLLYTLNNPNAYGTSSGDRFGKLGLAVSDSHIAVSAVFEDPGVSNNGIVYVFNASTGSLIWTINSPDVGTPSLYGSGDWFGSSVSMSGDYLLIGARSEQPSSEGLAGAAYLYRISTTQFLYKVSNPNGGSYADSFATTVSINSNAGKFVVGAPYEDMAGTDAGAVYTYSIASGTLQNSQYGSGFAADFGVTVCMSDNYIAVGSDRSEDYLQKVIIYNSSNALLHTLNNPNAYNTGYQDGFGGPLYITDKHLAISAPGEDDANNPGSGRVYMYNPVNGALIQTIENPNVNGPSASDQFGIGVAIINDRLYISAPSEGEEIGNIKYSSGVVYAFEYE